ncbi:MAG: hypothetical protein ABI977_25475 [Acidobacteriota bacterium]
MRACLERHFQNNLGTNVFLSGHFIEGDFNGDGSQDLAVDGLTTTLTPGTENTVLPNCTFVDLRPMIESQPGQKSLPNKDRPAVVGVIHGEGPIGWRSQNAKDTHWFWVHPVNSIEAQSSVRVFNFIESARSLKLKGDVVRLGMLSGQAGFAYYNGTSYEWHPVPNTTSP